MRRFINTPQSFVDDAIEGLALAHPDRMRRLDEEPRGVVRADTDFARRVTIATGGGSGHLPVFTGYVGRALVDGCAIGDLFASPSAEQMLAVTRAIDGGEGVLYLYGNYGGDTLNFDFASELAGAEGTSSCRRARWRSASASTASRECGAGRCCQQTRSQTISCSGC